MAKDAQDTLSRLEAAVAAWTAELDAFAADTHPIAMQFAPRSSAPDRDTRIVEALGHVRATLEAIVAAQRETTAMTRDRFERLERTIKGIGGLIGENRQAAAPGPIASRAPSPPSEQQPPKGDGAGTRNNGGRNGPAVPSPAKPAMTEGSPRSRLDDLPEAAGEEAVSRTAARQLGLPYVALDTAPPGPEAARLLDARVAARHRCIPIKAVDGRLVLAMADPLDSAAIEDVEFATGLRVDPVVAAPSAILRALAETPSRGARASGP